MFAHECHEVTIHSTVRALDLRIVGILDIFAITTDNFVTGTSVVPETSIAQRTSRLCSSFNKLQNDDIQ